jgi:translation initiation factor 6
LANDFGAIVHPEFERKSLLQIGDALKVEVVRATIAGIKTVGAAAVATNKGVLAHPHTTEQELAILKDVLKVPVKIGTLNYGTGLIGACLVANRHGAVVGSRTTPIEMGRVMEALGFIE